MTTNAALPVQAAEAPLMVRYSPDQVDLIKRTVAKGATDNELALFLYQCQRTGLDPLSRQIHFVKRAGQGAIQTGIDGYRVIAQRTGEYAGNDDPEYTGSDNAHPDAAKARVWRIVAGHRVSFEATARWSEYYPGEKQAFMWRKMPFLMLGKCAEALALRKAFPAELSGLYTHEEMAQAGGGVIEGTVIDPPPAASAEDLKDALADRVLGADTVAVITGDCVKEIPVADIVAGMADHHHGQHGAAEPPGEPEPQVPPKPDLLQTRRLKRAAELKGRGLVASAQVHFAFSLKTATHAQCDAAKAWVAVYDALPAQEQENWRDPTYHRRCDPDHAKGLIRTLGEKRLLGKYTDACKPGEVFEGVDLSVASTATCSRVWSWIDEQKEGSHDGG